ncbi:hypothetical protein QYF36_000904 [Acer negundo]|nr:hypothetical protein QYF36_000904 [Acer negundo]
MASSSSEVDPEATSQPSKPPNSAFRPRASRSVVPSATRASTSVASPPREWWMSEGEWWIERDKIEGDDDDLGLVMNDDGG